MFYGDGIRLCPTGDPVGGTLGAHVSVLFFGSFSHSYPFSPMSVIIFMDIISRNSQVADVFHLFLSLLFVDDVVLIFHQVVASNCHWRSGLESSVKWWE